jgi:hypothetical protein
MRIGLPEGTDVQPLIGLNLQVTIPISSTEGEVLAVPIAALSAGADGSTRIQVEEADGTVRFVHVAVGLRAQGYAEVRPVADERLEEGDRVVVGAGQDGEDGEDEGDTRESGDIRDGAGDDPEGADDDGGGDRSDDTSGGAGA